MTTPFFNNLMREDEHRQGEELRRKRESAPYVLARDLAIGQRFQYGTAGILTRIQPLWDEPLFVYGLSGNQVIRIGLNETVQTDPG